MSDFLVCYFVNNPLAGFLIFGCFAIPILALFDKTAKGDDMDTITVESKVWPLKAGDNIHVTTYVHRDGRRVRYVHGVVEENEAQAALLARRGNSAGTFGSICYFESFPYEDVCLGCVAIESQSSISPNGCAVSEWATSRPHYETGVRAGYCAACQKREADALKDRYERDLRILRAGTKGVGK